MTFKGRSRGAKLGHAPKASENGIKSTYKSSIQQENKATFIEFDLHSLLGRNRRNPITVLELGYVFEIRSLPKPLGLSGYAIDDLPNRAGRVRELD